MKADIIVAHPLKHHAFHLAAGCQKSNLECVSFLPLYNRYSDTIFKKIDVSLFQKYRGYTIDSLDVDGVVSSPYFLFRRLMSRNVGRYVQSFDSYFSRLIRNGYVKGKVFVSLQDYMPKSVYEAKRRGFYIWSDQILNNSRVSRSKITECVMALDSNYRDDFDFSLNESILSLADLVTSPSSYCDEGLVGQLSGNTEIVRIPYGVEQKHFLSKDSYSSKGAVKFLVRANSIRKGGIQFFEALEALPKNYRALDSRQLIFTLIGDLDPFVKAKMAAYKSPNNVKVLNKVVPNEKIPSLMKDSDIFIMPSLSESMSLMCVEAMQVGLPMLASKECGIDIFDNTMGMEVRAEKFSILEGILSVLENEGLWETWGRNASLAASKLTWTQYERSISDMCNNYF